MVVPHEQSLSHSCHALSLWSSRLSSVCLSDIIVSWPSYGTWNTEKGQEAVPMGWRRTSEFTGSLHGVASCSNVVE